MTSIAFLPAGLLALTLVCVFVMRSRSVAVKLTSEIALLVLIGGYLVARGTSPLLADADVVHGPDAAWLRALAVVWWLIAARLVATLTVLALGRDARSKQARLFSDLLAGAIYLTAALIILNSVLDLPVKGLLATSGVIAIVLGLALQNTLADLFSGIAVGLEQPFHLGNRITIGDQAEGIVVEMNWRSIRIQTDGEDIATIPNSIVARSQIINRSVPTERRAASVDIPTRSTARTELLMELTRQALLLCPAILLVPEPKVVIRHVGARKTTIGVNHFVATTAALGTARSQLLRQTRRLFRHAGIQDGHPPTDGDLLGNLVLFESLTEDQVADLAGHLVRHALDAGDVLIEQGSVGRSLYVVRQGIFELARLDPAGAHTVLGRMGPGEYFGEISMMSGDPRPVSVTALTAANVFELRREALEELLKQDAKLRTALEQSVRRGLALFDRDDAARTCHPLDQGGSLLARIRAFLRVP